MQKDEFYMKRCLQLAAIGRSTTAPNPMVGAVVVHKGKIIGEGYHTAYGYAHAEVEAIASVRNQELLKESTIYVNLEPCSHYGKTPPCASLIISKKIPSVVIGTYDPFPSVAGKGVEMLLNAGVKVKIGILEKECRDLNRYFFCFLEKRRPYIILKWAQTRDGFIDRIREEGTEAKPTPISNMITQMRVHKLRSEVQSILIGTNTAINDNPSLTVRNWRGIHPLRLIIDRKEKIPKDYKIFNDNVPTIVFCSTKSFKVNHIEYVPLNFEKEIIPQLLNNLYDRRIHSVLVEGGSYLLQKFINSGVWDEIQIEDSEILFGNGLAAPVLPIQEFEREEIGTSFMKLFKNTHN